MKSDSLYCSCCCLCNYTCIDFISHTNRNSCCTDRFLFISTICRCRFHSTIYRRRFRHFKKAISAIIRFFKRVLLEHNHVTQKPQYALLDQNAQVQKARQKSRKDKSDLTPMFYESPVMIRLSKANKTLMSNKKMVMVMKNELSRIRKHQ